MKIAVIVPIYNAEKTLKKCIQSVLNQTFKDLELILINDGSKDNSLQICRQYEKQDKRVVVIDKKNTGSVDTRKVGVENISDTCRYITFLDADDSMPKDALKKMHAASQKYQADMVCGRTKSVFKGIRLKDGFVSPCFQITEPEVYSGKEIIEKLYISYFGITNFPANLWGKLFDRKLIEDIIREKRLVNFFADDLSVMIRVLPQTKKLVIIPDIIYFYSVGGFTSKFMPEFMQDCLSMYEFKSECMMKYPMPQDAEKYMDIELINMLNTYFQMCIEKGNYTKEQMSAIIKEMIKNPFVKKAATSQDTMKLGMLLKEEKEEEIFQFIYDETKQHRIKKAIKRKIK